MSRRYGTKKMARLVAAVAVAVLVPASVDAQCVGNLADELIGFNAATARILAATFAKDSAGAVAPTWAKFLSALQNDGFFYGGVEEAGAAGQCMIDRKTEFRTAALAAVRRALPDTVLENKEREVRIALTTGAGAALATRYSASDRFGVFFGFGTSVIQHKDDRERFEVISRRGSGTDTETRQYIVLESKSQALPIATTGVVVRFRDRNDLSGERCGPALGVTTKWAKTCGYWVLNRLWPTSIFGALQFGGGEGPVSGTTLGVGWRVVGEINLLLGYGITRLPTLREDIAKSWRAEESGALLLPAGENAESIMGTQSQQSFTITLGIPLALRNALGGK